LEKGTQWVKVDEKLQTDPRLYVSDLADHRQPDHHDAVKLASVLIDLYNERTGPLIKEQATQ
jgi:hypothetical protein